MRGFFRDLRNMNLLPDDYQQSQLSSLPNRAVLVFSASFCKSCKSLSAEIMENFSAEQIRSHFFKVDAERNVDLSDYFSVNTLPSVLFFNDGILTLKLANPTFSQVQASFDNWPQGNTSANLIDISKSKWPVIRNCGDTFPVIAIDATVQQHVFSDIPGYESFTVDTVAQEICGIMNTFRLNQLPSDPKLLSSMFEYRVPTVSESGGCSNVHVLEKEPYNLALLGPAPVSQEQYADAEFIRNWTETKRLFLLKQVVDYLYEVTRADWIGIYRVVRDESNDCFTLVKESYRGEPSRPFFPLTEAFAKKSTNSYVGLTGKMRSIPNVQQRAEGVAYYECSGSVQSELCVPIVSSSDPHRIWGIIDLESWNERHFTMEMFQKCYLIANILAEWGVGTL